MNKNVQIDEDDQSFIETDTNVIPPEDIVSYTEMRSCAEIVRLLTNKDIDLAPDFQRNFVWALPAQTRFIEKLFWNFTN